MSVVPAVPAEHPYAILLVITDFVCGNRLHVLRKRTNFYWSRPVWSHYCMKQSCSIRKLFAMRICWNGFNVSNELQWQRHVRVLLFTSRIGTSFDTKEFFVFFVRLFVFWDACVTSRSYHRHAAAISADWTTNKIEPYGYVFGQRVLWSSKCWCSLPDNAKRG